MTKDLEDLAQLENLSDKAKAILASYTAESYTAQFSEGIRNAINRCKSNADAVNFLGRLETLYKQTIAPVLEAGHLDSESIVDSRVYQVEYRGNYPTLGHAIMDFRTQAGLSVQTVAKRANMSVKTAYQFEYNLLPKKKRSIIFYKHHEEKIKRRLLSVFKIPKEHEEDYMKIPLFSPDVPPARPK